MARVGAYRPFGIGHDFTHPFHTSGLGIAVLQGKKSSWLAVFNRFFSLEFLRVVLALALLLLFVGLLVWFFEKKKNQEQFGGSALAGVGSGFWWSAVTMTTVRYGDKAPKTFGGRIIGLVWIPLINPHGVRQDHRSFLN